MLGLQVVQLIKLVVINIINLQVQEHFQFQMQALHQVINVIIEYVLEVLLEDTDTQAEVVPAVYFTLIQQFQHKTIQSQ